MAFITFKQRFAACLLFASVCLSYAQSTIYKVSLDKQLKGSDQVIEGEVISKSSFWDDNHKFIYTAYTVKPYKIFKGNTFSTIEVIVQGGTLDYEAQVISHSLKLQKGDTGIFMLKTNTNNSISSKQNENPLFTSVSGVQGFYKYDIQDDKVVNSFSVRKGVQNFYNELTSISKQNFIEVSTLQLDKNSSQSIMAKGSSNSSAAIVAFSATENSAGTKSVLTISGAGFGSTKGTVGFSNANYGGALHTNALDNQVLSWSDTEIQVEIPDEAGTGTIKVNTNSNGSITSSENLIVDYSQINLAYDIGSGDEDYQTQHVDLNGEGGLTWTINQDFYNSDAMAPFESAMDTWTCESGMNWKVGSTITSNTLDPYDGVNLVTLGNLSLGTLGQTFSSYAACFQDGEIKWFVVDTDIIFNSNTNWNYTTSNPQSSEIDFESVAVHELGHAHQLGHVIDTNVVMHYSLSSGEVLRGLSNEDKMGANDISYRNVNEEICGENKMTSSSCAKLSNENFDIIFNNIKVFPNPSNGQFSIKNTTNVIIEKIEVYDIIGKQVYTNKPNNSRLINMNLNRQGIYVVNIQTDLGSFSKKLVVR